MDVGSRVDWLFVYTWLRYGMWIWRRWTLPSSSTVLACPDWHLDLVPSLIGRFTWHMCPVISGLVGYTVLSGNILHYAGVCVTGWWFVITVLSCCHVRPFRFSTVCGHNLPKYRVCFTLAIHECRSESEILIDPSTRSAANVDRLVALGSRLRLASVRWTVEFSSAVGWPCLIGYRAGQCSLSCVLRSIYGWTSSNEWARVVGTRRLHCPAFGMLGIIVQPTILSTIGRYISEERGKGGSHLTHSPPGSIAPNFSADQLKFQ